MTPLLAFFEEAKDRLQGRPFDVNPLQVVAGFFESDLGRIDSGVPTTKGIVAVVKIQIDRMKVVSHLSSQKGGGWRLVT